MSSETSKKNVFLAQNVGTRSLLAFWVLGVCNNAGIAVMRSAAHDILSGGTQKSDRDNPRDCNIMSTGTILLATVLPGIAVKFVLPFVPFHEHIRMAITTVSAVVAFCLVGHAMETKDVQLAFVGVALTSFENGLHESTIPPFMSFYGDKNVITAWGSGTGAGGFFAAFYYATMTGLGLSSTATLYSLVSVSVLKAFSFWILLDRPSLGASPSANVSPPKRSKSEGCYDPEMRPEEDVNCRTDIVVPTTRSTLTFAERLSILPRLVKYLIPVTLVYYFEFLINQGLFELLYFRNIWLNHHDQYRWYQVLYEIGVFISRSSLTCVKFNHLWMFAVLQLCNLLYLYFDSIYSLSPTIYLVFGLILFEGLLGGAAYTNTLYKIDTQVPIEEREFSMGVNSLFDTLGVCFAGLSAIPLHNYICSLPSRTIAP